MRGLSWRQAVRWGAIGGLILAFTAAIGMVETFDARKVIDPWISLGHLSLLWVPIAMGYRVAARPVFEGIENPPAGRTEVIAGAGVGLISGAGLAAFVLLAETFDLRVILINVTPRLLDLLTFGRGTATGVLIILALGLGLGALGGAAHLASPRVRTIAQRVVLWIVIIGFTELVFGNVLKELSLGAVDDFIYSKNRGVEWPAALAIAALVITLSIVMRGRAAAARGRFQAMPTDRRRSVGFAVAAGLFGIGMLAPDYFGPYLNEVLATVGLFMLMGFGLNIVVGFAGMLDLGYVAFFAVGAYSVGILVSAASPQFSPELAFFAAIPFIVVIAALAGLIVGTPVIRMRGDYLAIVTLAFGEIARLVFQADWLKGLFGGAQGIKITPSEIRILFGYVVAGIGVILVISGGLRWLAGRRAGSMDPKTRLAAAMTVVGVGVIVLGVVFPDLAEWTMRGVVVRDVFRLVLVFVLIAAFVSWRLEDSRVGRAWMAMREDEQVAQAMGINIVTAKLTAFIIGAVLASLGGALFAVKVGTIFPHSFKIVQSIIILVVVIVGGMGSLRGVAVGALVLIGILGGPTQPGMLREFEAFKLLIYGVLLVVMMLKRPEGLLPSARRSRELHQEEFMQDAWIKATADRIEEEQA
ncbi:MAG: hypothetical protein QY307_00140 [Acidimicrobiia bacterium]|nr:MAG: hypothetical protein QY307_00140 [Acidimicrobiia bacterium]